MINVSAAFFLGDSIPKVFNSVNKLALTGWLYFMTNELLKLIPKILDLGSCPMIQEEYATS